MPKALGSGSVMNVTLDTDLDSLEDCLQCVRRSWRCLWDLKGKAKSCIPCQDNKQRCEPVRAGGVVPQKRITEEPEDAEGALKWKQAQVAGNSLELLELNKTLKAMSEGIQGLIGGVDDRRKMDLKILGVLQDIQSVMQDFVWKSESDAWSAMQSIDGDQELVDLLWEKEEQEKKVSEMDVENTLLGELFPPEDLNQTLRE